MVASWLRARSDDCTTKVRDTPAVKLSDGPGIRMMIDDAWYDLTAWAPLHPGGAAILQRMDGQDATDAFYALHSDEALARLRQMKSTPCSSSESNSVPAVLRSFRTFRKQLQQRGFWVRSPFWETVFALHVCVLAALGAYLALQGWLLLSVLILSYAEVQAVWAGHDYGHARGRAFPFTYKFMYGVILGFSPTWWSNSHNAHHIYTNHDGVDLDIDSEPLFFFRFPPPKADTSFRCYQHWYWFPIITVTHFSWRMRSISQAWTSKNYEEFVLILLNYLWLSQLPLFVSLGSVLIAGFIVAVIVTGSHQAEDKFANDVLKCEPYNFVSTQFQTTRDVDTTSNWFFHCLWGGMQYQLEHHLFPTMPRYYYSQLAPEVKRFAAEHKLDYKRDGALEIILRNWKMIRYFAGDETERTMDKTDKNN